MEMGEQLGKVGAHLRKTLGGVLRQRKAAELPTTPTLWPKYLLIFPDLWGLPSSGPHSLLQVHPFFGSLSSHSCYLPQSHPQRPLPTHSSVHTEVNVEMLSGPPRLFPAPPPTMAAPTVPQELQEGQVYGPLPVGVLLHGDAVASGGKDLARPNGDQLAAFILARHVVEDSRVIDEGVQLPGDRLSPQSQEPCRWKGPELGP